MTEDYEQIEDDYGELPEMYEEEEIVESTKPKRKLNAKQLETVRKNLESGRNKINARRKKAKEDDVKYNQYIVQHSKTRKHKKYESETESEYTDEESEEEEQPKKSKKKQSGAKKSNRKEEDRLDKIESILLGIAKAQSKVKVKTKPQIVRNTIVQIPKNAMPKVSDDGRKLIRLFG